MEMWMWRCGDMKIRRCGDMVIDAAKLCLWIVEVLRYKTKKFSVNVIESCLYKC